MKDNTVMLKLLLFLSFSPLSSADTHSLQYFNTAVTPGTNFPEFIAVSQVDGEQCVYYDSTIRKAEMLEDWTKFDAKYPDYSKRETQRQQSEQERLKVILDDLNQHSGYTEGVHTVQMTYGCERDDDNGTTRSYLQYGYDGEDLISLDLKTGNWTAADHEAENYIVRSIPTRHEVKYWMDFPENECVERLKKFLFYGSEFLKRKGVHTVQRIYGCEHDDDDGTPRSILQYGYDGEDLISLYLKTGNWTVAVYFIVRWIPTREEAKYWMDFLENECIERLKKFLLYGSEFLKRKVRPTASVFQKHSSPEVVCHATGFFPKTVNITWQKDGEDVHEDVYLRETLPNQDGSFQKRSILNVSAEDLQKHTYTCVIQHSSLEKELVLEVPKDGGSSGVQIAVSVVVIILIAVVAGIVWICCPSYCRCCWNYCQRFPERCTATEEELKIVRTGLHTKRTR